MLREEWTTSAHVLFSLFFFVVFGVILFVFPISPTIVEEEFVALSGKDIHQILEAGETPSAFPILLKPVVSFTRNTFDSVWPSLRILFAFLTALGIYQLFNVSYFTSPAYKPVLPFTAAVALSFPLLPYFRFVYPEIPAFFLVALGLSLAQEMEEYPWSTVIVMAILPGGLAWLHPYFFPLGLGLFLFSVVRFRRIYRVHKSPTYSSALLIHFVLGGAGLAYYLYYLGHAGSLPEIPSDGWQSIRTAWNLLYESGSGLIYSSPFYVALVPAAIWAVADNRWDLLSYSGLIAVHYLALFSLTPSYFDAGRAWLPVIPLAVPLIMPLFGLWRKRQRLLFTFLLLFAPARALWKLIAGGDFLPTGWRPELFATESNYIAVLVWVAISLGICLALYPFNTDQEGAY